MRRELISNALEYRFKEICARRIAQLAPTKFNEQSLFVAQVREQMLTSSLTETNPINSMVLSTWIRADGDCLASLRKLCLGKPLQTQPDQSPPTAPFLLQLDKHKRKAVQRFHLLAERYVCPLNFALPAEEEIREHLLRHLMVQDRARVEKNSLAALASGDLLLRLNLMAVYTALVPDLRFLDALNYYYELMPVEWTPGGQHDWLLVSYLGLYARALRTWS